MPAFSATTGHEQRSGTSNREFIDDEPHQAVQVAFKKAGEESHKMQKKKKEYEEINAVLATIDEYASLTEQGKDYSKSRSCVR